MKMWYRARIDRIWKAVAAAASTTTVTVTIHQTHHIKIELKLYSTLNIYFEILRICDNIICSKLCVATSRCILYGTNDSRDTWCTWIIIILTWFVGGNNTQVLNTVRKRCGKICFRLAFVFRIWHLLMCHKYSHFECNEFIMDFPFFPKNTLLSVKQFQVHWHFRIFIGFFKRISHYQIH